MSFPSLTDEAKGSFGETFHLKTVVRTGVLGIYYWTEVRMESEEEHMGRQMETTDVHWQQMSSLKYPNTSLQAIGFLISTFRSDCAAFVRMTNGRLTETKYFITVIAQIFVRDLISCILYFWRKVRNLVAYENHIRIQVNLTPPSLYTNLRTNTTTNKQTRVRNFYAYENFCDYSILSILQTPAHVKALTQTM